MHVEKSTPPLAPAAHLQPPAAPPPAQSAASRLSALGLRAVESGVVSALDHALDRFRAEGSQFVAEGRILQLEQQVHREREQRLLAMAELHQAQLALALLSQTQTALK